MKKKFSFNLKNKIKDLLYNLKVNKLYYITGAEALPAPLTREEEEYYINLLEVIDMDDKFDLELFKTHLSEKISRYNDLISDLDEDSDIDMDKRSI